MDANFYPMSSAATLPSVRGMQCGDYTVEIRVRRESLPILRQMHARLGGNTVIPFGTFLGEIIEVRAIDARAERIERDALAADHLWRQPEVETRRRRPLTAEKIQLLLHLRVSLHLSAAALAQRFRISETSVKRILRRNEESTSKLRVRKGHFGRGPRISRAWSREET